MSRPVLRTALCDMLGIEYPVISAGMGPVGGGSAPAAVAELAAAVSNAGGLGVIGGAGFSPEKLREEINKVRALTNKPFGVDLLLPSNFMGQVAGQLKQARPAGDILMDMVSGAADILGRTLPARVTAVPAGPEA